MVCPCILAAPFAAVAALFAAIPFGMKVVLALLVVLLVVWLISLLVRKRKTKEDEPRSCAACFQR